jgi:aspartyl-tRNA(Asn)/glutamyl-tRNA(Gln) amidotransferase subunit B
MATYRPTIGLEVHAELTTRTKMFCDSANDPDETRPNVNVCPVCMAHPGTLPVINREAVRHILRVGAAVGGRLADFTEFDRKSYFYPDIPKGYQISQYIHPLVAGGILAEVTLTRIHLEEDTARSTHTKGKSVVDFNRAGIPLMELVTEPVIPDAETAGKFARELQLLLRTLGASGANLEKGEMRIEANVSVAKEGEGFGTKVEVKNLNSFRSVERAIAFEIQRQTALIEKGGSVDQETRGWDESKQETFHQRFKEGSADYRYFPEPDLPKLYISEIPEFSAEAIHASLPELPWEKREQLIKEGATPEAAEILVSDPAYSDVYMHQNFTADTDPKVRSAVISMLTTEVRGKNPTPAQLANLKGTLATTMTVYVSGGISSTAAKVIVNEMLEHGGSPEQIAKEKGLFQVHDTDALGKIVDEVLAEEDKAVSEYRSGKEAALQYLVGKAMKKSKGAGNPESLRAIIKERLG